MIGVVTSSMSISGVVVILCTSVLGTSVVAII